MHSADQLRFKISQLRADKQLFAVESIAVFVFSLFVSAFLPNLLLRYFYDQSSLTEVPPMLEYIPVAAFVVGVGYFLYTVVTNMGRLSKIKALEKELDTLLATHGDHCCDRMCDCEECEPHAAKSPPLVSRRTCSHFIPRTIRSATMPRR
jgi:hypothetical protein